MVLILVREAAEFPKLFCLIQYSMGQFGKISRCREFLTHLSQEILKILFCKNDK